MAFGLAEAAKLAVDLSLKGNFASALATNQKALKGFDSQVSNTGSRAYKAGTQIGTGIKSGAIIAAGAIGFLAANVVAGLHSLSQLDDVVAQTNAVLKSTKGAAGENAAAIRDLANKYEDLNATIDDTVIQSGENLLLTFTNIRQKAFEPALLAALNMNQALGRGEAGLTGTVRALGRALNDPSKGLVQLTRLGVTFTASEKKQIDAALKANDTYGAQTIILDKLNTKFGGSFLAGGQTTTGKIAKFKDAIDDLQRTLASALLPTIGKVADRLSTFLKNPAVIAQVSKLGDAIASLFSDQNLAEGGKILSSVFDAAKAAAPILVSTAQATLGIVKAAVGLFQSLPAPLQQLAVGAFAVNKLTGGLVTNIAGGIASIFSGLLKAKSVQIAAGVVTVNGGVPGVGGAVGTTGGLAGTLAAVLGKLVLNVAVVSMVAEVADLIHGVISPGGGLEGRTQSGNLLPADKLSWPFGPKNTPHVDLGPFHNIFGGDSAFATPGGLPNPILDRGGREAGGFTKDATGALARLINALGKQGSGFQFVLASLHKDFRDAFHQLSGAKTAEQIKAAILAVNKSIFGKGIGGSGGAAATEKTLRGILSKTDDPALRKVLSSEIRKVHDKVLGRKFEEGEFRKFDKILHSSESNKQKIAELQRIAKDVGAKDRANGARLQAKVDALRRSAVIAARQTTQAVKDKDLSLRLTIPVTNRTIINSRGVAQSNTVFSRYYKNAV